MLLTTVSDFTQGLITGKKTSSNGWISFNAVCCHHRGERPDSKRRGGLHPNPDGSINYHCFNCSYKASYQPGRHLNYSFRKLLYWLGASDNDVKRLNIEALRLKQLLGENETSAPTPEHKEIEFTPKGLPVGSKSLDELASNELGKKQSSQLLTAIEYLGVERGINIGSQDSSTYRFYLSTDRTLNMDRRVIVPCYWHSKLVGYTARALPAYGDIRPKYINQYDSNYVFNVDRQHRDNKFVIVSEGPFEAMSIDGVALMGKEITEQKADIIESLGKEIIVVPQAEKSSATLVDNAIEFGWNVSFPVWLETCKDMDEAVKKYGKLFVLKTILDAVEHTKVKIELRKRQYVSR